MSYNGWSNYETWSVSLWMDSDYTAEMAGECETVGQLAERLKSDFEEFAPDLENGPYCDLLNTAMGEVNWGEIAEHYEEDLAKPDDDEAEEVA